MGVIEYDDSEYEDGVRRLSELNDFIGERVKRLKTLTDAERVELCQQPSIVVKEIPFPVFSAYILHLMDVMVKEKTSGDEKSKAMNEVQRVVTLMSLKADDEFYERRARNNEDNPLVLRFA